ncbi:hypothetical protein NPX13_g7041 [Xylaria arbuscula]|uniref:Beta-glucuronidase C-terminal domain-containing protein n=1 Tax=Xylaria arbuscula TaxID=114810 RepID=A0A9W8NB85_9PEZI|nr:hypothetical protein NPX13_g7041 [Xylaria arbuscula]
MRHRYISSGVLASSLIRARANVLSYPISATVPSTAARLDNTPIGVSFEFDVWPTYKLGLSHVWECMGHITELYGSKMPIRIGGTTQDRSAYDGEYDGYIYPDPTIELHSIYGPKFFDLISDYGGETTLGFNRGDNDIANSLEAALAAKSAASDYLYAIELGNEPDLYYLVWNKPVATAPWNMSQEGENQAEWSQAFLDAWGRYEPILSAGNYAVPIELVEGHPNTDYLIKTAFNSTVKAGVKAYCTHSYALSGEDAILPNEMKHSKTVADMGHYADKIATAKSAGRPYIIGEAGFHGLETTQDATFAGAIQIVDKTLQAVSMGIQRIYYHQGSLGESQASFNWWRLDGIAAPFYGGYFASLAVAGAEHIVTSDTGNDAYAQYVAYKQGLPSKVVLINTDYFSGYGDRNATVFNLSGLPRSTLRVLRMAASSSEASVEDSPPTIGGQTFSNEECTILGDQVIETLDTSNGTAEITLIASEAAIVYIDYDGA